MAVIELGGGGQITDRNYRVHDVPLRGFVYYAELLGIEPEGGCDERGTVTPAPIPDQLAVQALLAEYGGLLDLGPVTRTGSPCSPPSAATEVVPRENHEARPAGRLDPVRQPGDARGPHRGAAPANKYNIHTDRHIIGPPRIIASGGSPNRDRGPVRGLSDRSRR